MQCWFIIWIYHKHTKLWSCSLRSKKSRHIIVNYLYWWYEMASLRLDYVTDPMIIWPQNTLRWSLQWLHEIVAMVWNYDLSHHITVLSLICWCMRPALNYPIVVVSVDAVTIMTLWYRFVLHASKIWWPGSVVTFGATLMGSRRQ